MLVTERTLRLECEKLAALKAERVTERNQLLEQDQQICQCVDIPTFYLYVCRRLFLIASFRPDADNDNIIPTHEQLVDLRAHVAYGTALFKQRAQQLDGIRVYLMLVVCKIMCYRKT
jgi:hypothetical protein